MIESIVGARRQSRLADYVRLARFDHVTKHVFVLPGIALAAMLRGSQNEGVAMHIVLGFVCVVAIASANYVINEWLDREFDKYHPSKSARTSVNVELQPQAVYGMWAALVAIGLGAAFAASMTMFVVAAAFATQGIVYNVPPIRSKDRAFLDVLSESVNNPLRLMIGWAMIDAGSLPPASIILAYWLGGGFLMAAKRLSEYREIVATHGLELLVRYRRSFAGYTEVSLFASTFAYALLSVSTFAVFLIKYRIEYALLLPFLCVLFMVYMTLSLRPKSVAQAPERLFSERTLMVTVTVFTSALVLLTVVNMPWLDGLTTAHFVSLR